MAKESDWITTTEAARISGYHIKHIRRLILSGRVNGKKLAGGREWQVSERSLLEYVGKVEKRGAKRGPKSGD